MEERDTGILLHKKDIELHREWFKEMTTLLGTTVIYRAPKEGIKNWDIHGDLDAKYETPIQTGVIFDEHPSIWTMKKLGWAVEQQEQMSIIHCAYDLPGLQAGSLFIIPSGIDNSEGRVFRVVRMSTIQVYPASIACEIAPEWEDKQEQADIEDFSQSDFNVLETEDNF